MAEPLTLEPERLPPAGRARSREEHLLLHADVPEDPGPEMPERRRVDPAGLLGRTPEKRGPGAVAPLRAASSRRPGAGGAASQWPGAHHPEEGLRRRDRCGGAIA